MVVQLTFAASLAHGRLPRVLSGVLHDHFTLIIGSDSGGDHRTRFAVDRGAVSLTSVDSPRLPRLGAGHYARLEGDTDELRDVEHLLVWTRGESGRVLPLACLSEPASVPDGASSLPLRPLHAGDDDAPFERLVLITATKRRFAGGSASPLRLTVHGRADLVVVESRDIGGGDGCWLELTLDRPMRRRDIAAIEISVDGDDEWQPQRLALFGFGRGDLAVALVDSDSLPPLSSDTGDRHHPRQTLTLPLLEPPHRYRARVVPSSEPMTVAQQLALYNGKRTDEDEDEDKRPETKPVGVALSGGGSRALVAGMGQLRGLAKLGVLGEVRALSTVSGGSWLGATWTYCHKPADELLGPYVDPTALTLGELRQRPVGIGGCVCDDFTAVDIGWRMVDGVMTGRFTAAMAWQQVIAEQILAPFGLADERQGFTLNLAARHEIAEQQRGPLDPDAPRLRLPAPSRPFLICNLGLVSREQPTSRRAGILREREICPVQSTPCLTGVFTESADGEDRGVGGGGVESFAFAGLATRDSHDELELRWMPRPWSLVDAVGTSSAFVAAGLVNIMAWLISRTRLVELAQYIRGPDDLRATLHEELDAALERILPDGLTVGDIIDLIVKIWLHYGLRGLLSVLAMEPRYLYTPVEAGQPRSGLRTFVDGGDFDNTGVVSLLRFEDVERIIAFVNTDTAIRPTSAGVPGEPGTEFLVSWDVAALFGYCYVEGSGYLYMPDQPHLDVVSISLKRTRVFARQDFAATVRALSQFAVIDGEPSPGPAVVRQTLKTVANPVAGIAEGREVEVLWCVLNLAGDWCDALPDEVRALVDREIAEHQFPNVSTFLTQLQPAQVNLLANLTAWSVAEAAGGEISRLFESE